MSGLFTFIITIKNGTKTDSRPKSQHFVKLFYHRKGRVKTDSINVRIQESQAGEQREKNLIESVSVQ